MTRHYSTSWALGVLAFVLSLELVLVAYFVSQPMPCTPVTASWPVTLIPLLIALVVVVFGVIIPCFNAVRGKESRHTTLFGVLANLVFAVLLIISIIVLAHQLCGAVKPGWTATLVWAALVVVAIWLFLGVGWWLQYMTSSSPQPAPMWGLCAGYCQDEGYACLGGDYKDASEPIRSAGYCHIVTVALLGIGVVVTLVLIACRLNGASVTVLEALIPVFIGLALYTLASLALGCAGYLNSDEKGNKRFVYDALIALFSLIVVVGLVWTAFWLPPTGTDPYVYLAPLYVALFIAFCAYACCLSSWMERDVSTSPVTGGGGAHVTVV